MKIELRLETVTPLFLGGAMQQPELRPSSVRGALRYWLRAALGGMIGDADLGRLHEFERSIFGDTDHASAVTVRLTHNFDSRNQVKEPLLPHRRDRTAGETSAIPCGTPFSLSLSLRPSEPSTKLELAAWCALLWVMLGGLGRRSRRGAGSLRLTDFDFIGNSNSLSQELKDCLEAAKRVEVSGSALAERLGELIDKVRATLRPPANTSRRQFNDPPHYSILLDDTRVVVWTPEQTDLNDYKTALTPLMDRLSDEKADDAAAFVQAFGGISPQRRASPLYVTTHRLADKWALVCTYLKAEIQRNDNGQPQKVTDFLNALSPRFEAYPRPTAGGEKT